MLLLSKDKYWLPIDFDKTFFFFLVDKLIVGMRDLNPRSRIWRTPESANQLSYNLQDFG